MNFLRPNGVAVWAFLFLGIWCLAKPTLSQAGFSYGDFFGMTVDFLNVREESATDPLVALYKAPMVFGNQSLFFTPSFQSTSSGGAYDTTSGTLSMTLSAKPGFALSSVRITEYGNYALTGSGSEATFASIDGLLQVGSQSIDLAMTPNWTWSMPGVKSGSFTATAFLDFSGLGITTASFSLFNELQTSSEAGTTATIGKSVVSDTVQLEFLTTPVPLPGGLVLLGSGLCSLFGLRRLIRKRVRSS
jgi:hypothetical protein